MTVERKQKREELGLGCGDLCFKHCPTNTDQAGHPDKRAMREICSFPENNVLRYACVGYDGKHGTRIVTFEKFIFAHSQ